MSSRSIAFGFVLCFASVVAAGLFMAGEQIVGAMASGGLEAWRPTPLTWCSLVAVALAARVAHGVRAERRQAEQPHEG